MRKLSPTTAVSHAFKSLVAYRVTAVRIGLVWIPVMMALDVAELMVGPPVEQADSITTQHLLMLLSAIVGVIGFSSMAVNWHRFILRDESPSRFRVDGLVLRYVGNSMLVMLVMGVPLAIVALASSVLEPLAILLVPLALAAGAIVTRLSIKLPAVALGKNDFTFRDAWKAGEGNGWQLLMLFLLNAAIVFGILLVIIVALTGIEQASPILARVVEIVVRSVASLFLTLFNASIFTSLYGFFVERRDF